MKDKKFNTPTVRFGIPNITAKLPKFWNFKIPIFGGLYMGGGKFVVISFSTIAIGFIASLFVLINSGEQQITFPMLGAQYTAPSMVGNNIVDREFPADRSQTLQINMPANLRLDLVSFKNINLGKQGLTDAFQIAGTSTSDVITIETVTIKNSSFPTMDWANGNIFTVNATSSVIAAGHTFSPTMASSTNDVVIGSGRGATSYIAEDMTVDRILLLQSTTGGDVIIANLIIDNVNAWTGGFNADWFEIGSLVLENVKIGSDANINTADLIINSTVYINNMTDGTQEQPIIIR